MTDLALCLAACAWLTAGAATWLRFLGKRIAELDRYDWFALAGSLFFWPVLGLYVKAWLRGYEAGRLR